MKKLLGHFLLTARDLGIEKYTVEEIAERMKPGPVDENDPLLEFASTISSILDDNTNGTCEDT